MYNVEVETGRRRVPVSIRPQTLPGEAETRGCAVFFPSNFRFLTGGLALLLVAGTGPALAQTADLTVTAQIQASCVLNGGTLNFGTYTSTDSNPAEGQGSFNYICTNGTDITVTLGSGQNEQGGNRRMARAGGGGTLTYALYKNSNHTDPWGVGTDGIEVDSTSAEQTFVDVYGLIEAGQASPAGTYNDVVQITLNIN
jgi:spore coat protein U-like protein